MAMLKRKNAATRKPVFAPSPAYPGENDVPISIDDLKALIEQHDGAMTLVIDPVAAQWVLDHFNQDNRTLSLKRAEGYADVMEEGGWRFTGETIIFSREALNTGQHRLSAVVQYGKPLRFLCVFGINRDAFVVTDTGRPHNASDVLKVRGVKNNSLVAASLRLTIAYSIGLPESLNRTIGADLVDSAFSRWPDMEESTTFFSGFEWKLGIRTAATNTMSFFSLRMHGEEKTRRFLSVLATGATDNLKHPARVLRERLGEDKISKNKLLPVERFALCLKALNAFTEERDLSVLRYKSYGPGSEKFPVVTGLKL